MTPAEKNDLVEAFGEALKNALGDTTYRGRASISNEPSAQSNMEHNTKGYIGRDESGRFTSAGTYEGFLKELKKISEDNSKEAKEAAKIYEHNIKLLNDIEKKYENRKGDGNNGTDDDSFFMRQIALEKALVEETKARFDYNKAVEDNRDKEVSNSATYMRIKAKNYEHELELDEKRLKFQEKNLEKTQAIANKQLEIEQIKQEAELKGRTKDGKKKATAEISEATGKLKAFNAENTGTRAAAMAISAVTNKMSQGVNFLSDDKKVSITDVGNKIADVADKLGPIGSAVGGIVRLIAAAVEAYDKINAASSKYSRSVGGGKAKMEAMKKTSVDVANEISKWGGNTYKFNEILEHTAQLSEATGRVMDHMSTMDFKSLEDLTRHGITPDIINQYDTFGLSVEEIDKRITGVYKKAGKHGLNAKAVTSAVNKNLKMAQQYTFAGGQRALERMAEKSVALKYNMEAVSRFADKVSTLEGAAQSGAQLSVLGGNFARMGNPLSMLYGGLQDPERLNDMMLNMVRGMAHWDRQKGQIDLAAADRMRIKAASEATGIDYNDFLNMAMNQERQSIVGGQIRGNIDDDTRQYIQNLAQVRQNEKTGEAEAYIRLNGEDRLVSSLTEKDKDALRKESEAMKQKDKAKIGDVYEETRTITDMLNDYIDWIRNRFFRVILKIAGYDEETIGAMTKYNLDAEDAQKVVEKEREHRLGYGAAGLGTGALIGGIIGSIIPGIGTAIGAAVGGLIGGAAGAYGGYKAGDAVWDSDAYAAELAKADKYQKKAHGGIVRGKGTPTSDSIPARLSDGEFVMNAKATSRHLPQLQAMNAEGFSEGSVTPIRAGENQMKHITVEVSKDKQQSSQSSSPARMSMEPITINIGGTIRLDAGNGFGKDVDASKLLTNDFVNKLLREIEVATHNSLDKANVRMKYPS